MSNISFVIFDKTLSTYCSIPFTSPPSCQWLCKQCTICPRSNVHFYEVRIAYTMKWTRLLGHLIAKFSLICNLCWPKKIYFNFILYFYLYGGGQRDPLVMFRWWICRYRVVIGRERVINNFPSRTLLTTPPVFYAFIMDSFYLFTIEIEMNIEMGS